MEAEWKKRPDEDGSPPREARGFTFGIGWIHAVTMMMKVRGLDGMHAAEHEDAEGVEGPILDRARPTERVVLRAVGDAQAGEEEIEGSECAKEEVVRGIEVDGDDEPRKRQGKFENALPLCDGDEVAPWDGCGLGVVGSPAFMMHRERAHGFI